MTQTQSIALPDALRAASFEHQAGRLEAAEAIYRQIIQHEPKHAEALHMLGICMGQRGQHEAAIDFIQQAVATSDTVANYHINLGVMLDNLGRAEEAIAAYLRGLSLDPAIPEVYSNLSHTLRKMGKPQLAIQPARQALVLRPDFGEAFNNLGAALHESADRPEAIVAYQQAIVLRPDSPDAYNNLANSLALEPGRAPEAIAAYKKALELKPDFAVVLNNLAKVLLDENKLQESLGYCERALKLSPDFPDALNNYGNALHRLRRLDEAIAVYQKALTIVPRMADLHNNLGNVYHDKGELDAAIECFHRALELRPIYAEAYNNLGYAAYGNAQYEQALHYCRHALQINPNFQAARWNIALILLLLGDFEPGWREYGRRWTVKELDVARPKLGKPEWDGSDLTGKTILLYPEQGYGDCIQFIRYLPLLKDRGARVVVVMPPELVSLLNQVPGLDQMLVTGAALPPFDCHCPLMSLPSLFGTTLATIPGGVPYLHPDSQRLSHWRARMPAGKLKIGISWAGRATHPNDHNRTMGLARFAALASVPDTWFCSLQKGAASIEARTPPPGMHLVDWTDELTDFSDTAALIGALDMIISVDTAVVHVAGAMNKPAWVFLPLVPDWRWLLDRTDSPWYPSIRLFRQVKYKDWEKPIGDAVAELQSVGRLPTT